MKFRCERCGHNKLEEVMESVVVSTIIKNVGEGGDIDYGNQSNDEGEVRCYQCVNCGEPIMDDGLFLTTSEELYDWLQESNML